MSPSDDSIMSMMGDPGNAPLPSRPEGMTDNEINIAIAKACGWNWCEFRYRGKSTLPNDASNRRKRFIEPAGQSDSRDWEFIGICGAPDKIEALGYFYGIKSRTR